MLALGAYSYYVKSNQLMQTDPRYARTLPSVGMTFREKNPQPDPNPMSQQTFERLLNAANFQGKDNWERARDIAILLVLRDTGGRCGSSARSLRLVEKGSAEIHHKYSPLNGRI